MPGGRIMTPPRISVLLPVYNAERYLGEAVESILGQTFRDFELLVIDDGSTDRSGEIIAEFAPSRPPHPLRAPRQCRVHQRAKPDARKCPGGVRGPHGRR
jgi:glycosyltransferase involved in cell wall biosynthesis